MYIGIQKIEIKLSILGKRNVTNKKLFNDYRIFLNEIHILLTYLII